MGTFWIPFITGLTTGGISCFAVQGSLLTSALITQEKAGASKRLKARALVVFLIAKLISYTLLGLLLGILGSKLIILPKVQGWFQIAIGIYMLMAAANLANLHPVFRYFILRPPKFIFRLLRNQTKVNSFFTPIFLGALTVFIPCGITQAMMLLAVSAGNPLTSALILFSFILGTMPVFFLIGLAVSELFRKKAFTVIAALIVAVFGIVSINSGQILRGSAHTFQNYWKVIFEDSASGDMAPIVNGFQEVKITVTATGYQTNVKKLRAGIPTKLILSTNSVVGCSRAFTIPDYNISKILPVTGGSVIEFTPTKTGNLTYTCSMGMYSGQFTITN